MAARRGPVFYVGARRAPGAPRALLHAPGGARLLVVPAVLAERRPVFTVAGCWGYELTGARARPAEVA
jgi:hypothetical protein